MTRDQRQNEGSRRRIMDFSIKCTVMRRSRCDITTLRNYSPCYVQIASSPTEASFTNPTLLDFWDGSIQTHILVCRRMCLNISMFPCLTSILTRQLSSFATPTRCWQHLFPAVQPKTLSNPMSSGGGAEARAHGKLMGTHQCTLAALPLEDLHASQQCNAMPPWNMDRST